ncbi:hypothetical protein [Egbenema bharatensis]|uniref:hypothetical protein n=1 Tax=Egbenema bharatensis TaxID=3463334 RepID=UPI003A8977B7
MQSSFDHHRTLATSPLKRLGGYLVEAGLLTPDQVSVILNDQQSTGMRFGEIVVARGWVKEQTIEWIVKKVVEPERHGFQKTVAAAQPAQPAQPASVQTHGTGSHQLKSNGTSPTVQPGRSAVSSTASANKSYTRRELPIAKPLPSVGSKDGDVNWVG